MVLKSHRFSSLLLACSCSKSNIFCACVCVTLHCKNTIPEIQNKYSQKSYCSASVPIIHIYVSVSDLYITMIGLPILLQENMWTDPGNKKIAHRHMNVECGNLNGGSGISFLRIHKWCSARDWDRIRITWGESLEWWFRNLRFSKRATVGVRTTYATR